MKRGLKSLKCSLLRDFKEYLHNIMDPQKEKPIEEMMKQMTVDERKPPADPNPERTSNDIAISNMMSEGGCAYCYNWVISSGCYMCYKCKGLDACGVGDIFP